MKKGRNSMLKHYSFIKPDILHKSIVRFLSTFRIELELLSCNCISSQTKKINKLNKNIIFLTLYLSDEIKKAKKKCLLIIWHFTIQNRHAFIHAFDDN